MISKLLAVVLGLAVLGSMVVYFSEESNEQAELLKKLSDFPGQYIVQSVQQTSNGMTATIQYNGSANNWINQNNVLSKQLKVDFIEDNVNELNIRIQPTDMKRFVLPYNDPFPYTKNTGTGTKLYTYKIAAQGQPFGFSIQRVSTGETIFDCTNQTFIFSDMYLELTTAMAGEMIYGLGERRQSIRFKSGTYSFWTKDAYGHMENGQPNGQTYGHHPMYLMREASGLFHVNFFRNPNGMQVVYTQNTALTYKSIGSIFEYKFFLGGAYPEEAIKLYHQYVNGWILHPFWA